MVNVAPVPDWLENAVGQAEDKDVLHRFFTKVVVDSENLFFNEERRQLLVELAGAGGVLAERLLQHDPFVLAVSSGQARLGQAGQNLGEGPGRRGEEGAVVRGRQRPRRVPVRAAHVCTAGGDGGRFAASLTCARS